MRSVSVVVSGHTVEQLLSYDVAEAEAVFGQPFDDKLDTGLWMAMYSPDRIWLDETLHRVASATSYVLDGKCIRTAKIEHCDEIAAAGSHWSITRADGTPVETELWSCVPGTPPISHSELMGHRQERLSDPVLRAIRAFGQIVVWPCGVRRNRAHRTPSVQRR